MIELKGVSKKYKNGTHALYDVNLKVDEGEFVFVMGPTGSGKSTLVKLLDGEEVPTSGKVLVSGIDVGRLKKSKVYMYRRKIGVVFQDYRLLPEKTVFENVAYALEVLDMPTDKIKKRVRDVLKLVDLSDKSNSKPKELSGGQQQRVAIARAVAKRPMIIIADEPTGNLDPNMTEEMIALLEKINKEEHTTILVVTHELTTVEKHPKRTIRIEKGHVVSDSIYKPKKKQDMPEEVVGDVDADGVMFMTVSDDEDDVPETSPALEGKKLSDTIEEKVQALEEALQTGEVKVEPSITVNEKEQYVIEDYTGSNEVVTEENDQTDALSILDEAVQDIASTMELFSSDGKAKEDE
ncbi:MAG: ATP-binding cassette domain-containing protein [Erysipelotrichaceae bacterium]|nr:ATP-binding cassette domain-containing protein [Erysipelotrichaceae bacterium]